MKTTTPSQTTMRDFLYTTFKRKNQILFFAIFSLSIVAIGTFVIDPVYEASTKLLVKVGRENVYIPSNAGSEPIINFNSEAQINSEIALLKGNALAEKVFQSLGITTIYNDIAKTKKPMFIIHFLKNDNSQNSLKDKALLLFQKNLKVEGIKTSNVIDVSFKHKDPKIAAQVVNAIADAYLNLHLEVYKSKQSYNFFKDQSDQLENRLKKAEDKLKSFKESNNITAIKEEQNLLLNQKSDLYSGLNATISEKVAVQNRIKQLQHHFGKTSATIPQSNEVDLNPYLINTLESSLIQLELKEKELLGKYTQNSHLVQNVREEINIVRDKLAKQEEKHYGRSSYGPNMIYQRLEEEIFTNKAELKALIGKIQTQESQLLKYDEKLDKLKQLEISYAQIQREVDSNRQDYQLYRTRLEESRISNEMDEKKIANVSIVEVAQPPFKPVSPKVFLNLGLGFLFAVFGGFGIAFFLEYLNDKLEKIEDVEKYLDLPVLTSLPEFKA